MGPDEDLNTDIMEEITYQDIFQANVFYWFLLLGVFHQPLPQSHQHLRFTLFCLLLLSSLQIHKQKSQLSYSDKQIGVIFSNEIFMLTLDSSVSSLVAQTNRTILT